TSFSFMLLICIAIFLMFMALRPANAASEEDFTGFPEEIQGLWCISLGESAEGKIILNPIDGCEQDGGVVLISYSQYVGPGDRYCALDEIEKLEEEIPKEKSSVPYKSSAVYQVHLRCMLPAPLPVWTDFKIHRNDYDDGDSELVIRLSPQG